MAKKKKRKTSAALVVRRPPAAPRQSVVVVDSQGGGGSRRAPSALSRSRGYLSRGGGLGGLMSGRRLKRGGALVVGGAAADLLGDTLTSVLTPGQAAVATALTGYFLGDGGGSFLSSVGDGMLANAGGDYFYAKLRSWLSRGTTTNTSSTGVNLPGNPNFIGPPAP